jgi:hypothetical protein
MTFLAAGACAARVSQPSVTPAAPTTAAPRATQTADVPSAAATSVASTSIPEVPLPAAVGGLYFVAPDRSDTCALQGRWLACLGLRTADGRADPIVLAVSAAGNTLKPLRDGAPSFTLGVPGDAGAARTLRSPDGVVLTQQSDPYLARIEQHLPGLVFVRLEMNTAPRPGDPPVYSKDTITMQDALMATVDVERDQSCEHALLFPDPTWNRSIPLGPAKPPPAAGALGMRTFTLLKLQLECAEKVDPLAPIGLHGMLGGVKLFADADGVPAGLLVEGYMYAEIFVTRGATRDALDRMIAAVAQGRGHQAE